MYYAEADTLLDSPTEPAAGRVAAWSLRMKLSLVNTSRIVSLISSDGTLGDLMANLDKDITDGMMWGNKIRSRRSGGN